MTREKILRDKSNKLDDVSGKDLADFEDAKMGTYAAGRNPLKSFTTPLDNTDEGSYEATAVLYAASACGVPDLSVIYGAGKGSTQISAVESGSTQIVGTSFHELGSKGGIDILTAAVTAWGEGDKNETDFKVSLKARVEEWGKTVQDTLETWTMESSIRDIKGERATVFLKKHSEKKTVVGISAVFYSMSLTKEINDIDDKAGLTRITQPAMVAALRNKLNVLLNFEFDKGKGKYVTKFENFDHGSDGAGKTSSDEKKPLVKTFDEKKFLTELANVKLHLMYADMLYHETATFTLAREWKVHGKPFRTTWSTGWYVTHHLPIPTTAP